MAAACDRRQPDFQKTTLPEHARRVFDLMFKPNAPGRTTHVLTREYAHWFLELAQHYNRKLFSKTELALIRPPYPDGGRNWRGRNFNLARKRFTGWIHPSAWILRTTRWAVWRGPWELRLQTSWLPEDSSAGSVASTQLGWTADRFGQIDRAIEFFLPMSLIA